MSVNIGQPHLQEKAGAAVSGLGIYHVMAFAEKYSRSSSQAPAKTGQAASFGKHYNPTGPFYNTNVRTTSKEQNIERSL